MQVPEGGGVCNRCSGVVSAAADAAIAAVVCAASTAAGCVTLSRPSP